MTLRRYLTALIWLCIAPLLVLSAVLAVDHVRDVQQHAGADARALLQQVSAAIDEDLRDQIKVLQLLSESPLADDPAREADFYAEAQNFQRVLGSHVAKFDGDGRDLVFSTRRPRGSELPPPARPRGRGAIDIARETRQGAVGDIYVGSIAGEPAIAIAVPAMRNGRIRFYLLSSTETRRLARHLVPPVLPPGSVLSLHDSTGETIAQQGPAGAAKEASMIRLDAAMATAPWTLRLQMPRTAHMAPMVTAGTAVGVGLVLLTLVGAVGGHVAARRLNRAMQSLVVDAPEGVTPATVPTIHEVAAIRARLDDARERRDAAEAERRADEQRFRESMAQTSLQLQIGEARLRGIFDNASEGILTVDADQQIAMINPAAAQIVGYRVDELLGRPLAMLIPERLREQHLRNLRALGESERASVPMSVRPSLLALHASGREIPIEAAVSHVHVDGQRLFTVIFRDVTERLRNEEQLRSEKAKLDAALASMTDAVCIADADGRVLQFNDAFVSFHRFTSRAAFPATRKAFVDLVELLDDEGRPLPVEQRVLSRALRGETASNLECRLRRSDSGEQWVGSYSFAPIRDAAGLITGAVLVGRDVTAMRQMHAEVLASHVALRRLVAAQDKIQEEERKRVARELHDDLQQTLAAIKMDTLAIGQQLQREPARVPPMLAKIDELATAAIASTRRIVNDLRPRMLEELGLRPALEALASDFAQRTGIDCRLDIGDDHDDDAPIAPAAATCLYRVAQEGLNNVHKHAAAKHVRISLARSPQQRVRLRIADDGKGLSPADRQKRYSFGLVGMDERVHAVGGQLQLSSMPGGGTVIEVDVPAHDESRASGY
ncbi:MAG: PAS domain S-box protein [Burkholderiaceae bacterium]|nr:PAS domain S-box protein [Burkholderiaceae bacterium]